MRDREFRREMKKRKQEKLFKTFVKERFPLWSAWGPWEFTYTKKVHHQETETLEVHDDETWLEYYKLMSKIDGFYDHCRCDRCTHVRKRGNSPKEYMTVQERRAAVSARVAIKEDLDYAKPVTAKWKKFLVNF